MVFYSVRNSSTGIASCRLTNKVLQGLQIKVLVGGIFYDLEKTFDCVNYEVLLNLIHQLMHFYIQ